MCYNIGMGSADLSELLKRDPFEPFRLRLSSGDAYDVRDPHSVAVMKNRLFMALPDGERWTFISYLHVAAVESIGNGS